MTSAQSVIVRLRRDLTLGALLKIALLGAFLSAFILLPARGGTRTVAIVAVIGVYAALTLAGARESRLNAGTPALIAAGRFEQAERQIDRALRNFSVVRAAKLQSLHHLALLRHAQRRWEETAFLSRALLGQRLGAMRELAKPARLLLADSMLELGDLRGAYEALSGMHALRLSLLEMTNLLALQVDYESRVGGWAALVAGVMSKVQLAEIMPPAIGARTQAMLALAARRTNRPDLCDWLRRRAELLADASRLCAERPMLRELWPTVP